eukprot:TRINITY_DN928_c0_g1_i1.p1 TRINITY_DN928_c0_g1~~TRINITY_DN928_c0_g1_i1.p1  ORF type:complete len:549 (+),score=40.32 TRINITY_DN928_c0_g1_i1:532-2178(+)
MSTSSRRLIHSCILVALFAVVYGIIVDENIHMGTGDPQVSRFDWFGFRAGGDMMYNLTATNDDKSADVPHLYFMLCTDDQWTEITKQFRKPADLCLDLDSDNSIVKCELVLRYQEPINEFHRVETTSTYYLVHTRCSENVGIDLDLYYKLCNRASDGSCQHLGTGYFPLPYLFLTLLFIWPLILAMWMINWFWHRDQNVRLQWCIASLPVFKIINVAIYYIFWERCSRTGHCGSGQLVSLFYSLSFTVYRCVFFLVLLLVAKGWCIMRSELAPVEKKLLAMAISFIAITSFFTTYVGGYVLLALLMVYIGVVWFIFTSISVNTKALKVQLGLIREAGFDPESTPAHDKMQMFQTFQTCMIVYVILDVLNFFIGSFWLNRMPWIEMTITNALELFLYLAVCWTFRLRDFSPYFSRVPELVLGDEETMFNGVAEGEGGELRSWSWERGDPLPGAPPNLLNPFQQPQPRPVVVVQNPSTRDADGTIVPNVAVGTAILAVPSQQAYGGKGKMGPPSHPSSDTESTGSGTATSTSSSSETDSTDLNDRRSRRS